MRTTIIDDKPYFHHSDFSEIVFQNENNEEVIVNGEDMKELILKNYLTDLVSEELEDDDDCDKLLETLDNLTLDETFIVDAIIEKIKRDSGEAKEHEFADEWDDE